MEGGLGHRNVPIGLPVLLHGKEQAVLRLDADPRRAAPAATLMDATGRNPEFTPDVMGQYTVTVTDEATGEPVTLVIYAGTWQGVIVGQDAAGNPTVDASCTACHGSPPTRSRRGRRPATPRSSPTSSTPTPTTARAASPATPSASTPSADNGGIDDASDYQAFLDSGLHQPG